MGKKVKLQVPVPCHENWDRMTTVQKGRFCASCQKKVIDFSAMSNREVAVFFRKPSAVNVCGRFRADQLDTDIDVPRKRIPWIKYLFQISMPAFLLSMKATAQKQRPAIAITTRFLKTTRPVNNSCHETLNSSSPSRGLGNLSTRGIEVISGWVTPTHVSRQTTRSKEISGNIVDENGYPVPYATVLVKGTNTGASADSLGRFILNWGTKAKKMIFSVSAAGFVSKDTVLGNTDQHAPVTVQLQRNEALDSVTVSATGPGRTLGLAVASTSIWSEKKILGKPPMQNIRVYPNPVSYGSTLNIAWGRNEYGSFVLQLFNQQGQLVYAREIQINNGVEWLNMVTPSVTPGNYFLKITNGTKTKAYTAQLVIQ